MTQFVMLSDIVEQNGKTVKENNLSKQHLIPIGSLVELSNKDYPDEAPRDGLRLFVVHHSRDCDGTPLYDLSAKADAQQEYEKYDELRSQSTGQEWAIYNLQYVMAMGAIMRHYSEESLTIIRMPTEWKV